MDDRSALRDLRRARQLRRLGDTEWFDVAYRVYLFALGGMIAVVIASDAIDGLIGNDVTTSDLLGRGPSILGVAVASAIGLGMRSGADGGPVAVEVADIRHVLLAPLSRRRAMLRPVAQRIRSMIFSLGLAGAVLGQFVGREVDGSRAAWAGAGALFGGLTGAMFVTTAVVSHALRLPRWGATLIAAVVVGWQCAAAWVTWSEPTNTALRPGPTNLAGSLAFWGIRQRGIDVVAIVVALAAIVLALALGGRLRIEPLARRGKLVSQLRFAATVQDLRTVVMLRRQLRAETLRSRPWFGRVRPPLATRTDRSSHTARFASTEWMIWRRGLRSLRRLPASRLGRIATLAALGGVCGALTVSSSLLFLLGLLAAVFLVGMESIEPLSQEVDRPDLTDGLPVDRGELYTNHLVAPAVLLAIAGLIGAGATSVVEPRFAAAALAIAIPTALLGAVGPVVGTVLDAPTPIGVADTNIMGAPRNQETSMVPPEFAGFSNAFSTFMPLVLSALGLLPTVAMRADPSAATALRAAVGTTLALAVLAWWIRRRDGWGVKIRAFFEVGREQKAAATR